MARPNGHGSAAGLLATATDQLEFRVDHSSDALGNLVQKTIDLAENYGQFFTFHDLDSDAPPTLEKNNTERFHWSDEPWGHRWGLKLHDDLTLQVVVNSMIADESEDDPFDSDPSDPSTLHTVLPLAELVTSVLGMLQDVLSENGFVGYKKFWIDNEFPISGMLYLRAFLEEGKIDQMTLEQLSIDEEEFDEDEEYVEEEFKNPYGTELSQELGRLKRIPIEAGDAPPTS